jgi:hypothetical protein
MTIKADGSLVLMHAEPKGDRAYALFRVHMPASEELLFLVRLYSNKSEGGIVAPGGASLAKGLNVKSELYDKPGDAIRRCEEWNNPRIEVPELVEQPS